MTDGSESSGSPPSAARAIPDLKNALVICACWGYIFVTITHCIPFRIDWPVTNFFDPVYEYLNIRYLYGMFSQIPKENTKVTAVVTLRSGKQVEWKSPSNDLSHSSLGRRAVNDRYRKLILDLLIRGKPLPSNLYPDAAEFIARQVAPADDPPTKVEIFRHDTPIRLDSDDPATRLNGEEPTATERRRVYLYVFADKR